MHRSRLLDLAAVITQRSIGALLSCPANGPNEPRVGTIRRRVGSIRVLAGLRSVTIKVTLILVAIKRFRHKGLERFFATGSIRGIQAKHADRLRLILGRLNVASVPRDLNLPGLSLHELQGTRAETWAVKVSGNWRITFVFAGPDVDRVDYEDYH